jgi:hypothetical protein
MGQAAGTAAVQSMKTGQSACDLDTAQLVETLRANDAYLPQESLSAKMTRALGSRSSRCGIAPAISLPCVCSRDTRVACAAHRGALKFRP